MRITTAEFIKNYGRFADTALGEPVIITKNGHDRLVVIAANEYERLKSRDVAVGEPVPYIIDPNADPCKEFNDPSRVITERGKQRAREFVEWAESHREVPILSEEAMSRASMYSDRW